MDSQVLAASLEELLQRIDQPLASVNGFGGGEAERFD
jgi:hypothetical protein